MEIEEHTDNEHMIPEAFPWEFRSAVFEKFPPLQEHVKESHTPTLFECQ